MELSKVLERLPEAVVSHRRAAGLWGVPVSAPDELALTVPRSCRRTIPGVVTYRRDLPPAERCMRGGVPVTTPLRTGIDCGRDLPFEHAVVMLDGLVNAGRVTVGDLRNRARRQSGPGSAALQRAVRMTEVGAGSGLETAARLLFRGAGILVIPQYRLHRDSHAYDFAIVAFRLLIEIEGFAFHASRNQLDRDAAYATEAAVAGWRLLRFTWEDITLRPEQTVATVRRAMGCPGRAGHGHIGASPQRYFVPTRR